MDNKVYIDRLPKGFTVTAHTGCLGTVDNTLESVTVGTNCGADIFEIDLNFDSNNAPVLSHDTPEGNDNLPFEKAIKEAAKSDTIRINIDIKQTTNLVEMERIVLEYGFGERAFLTGVLNKFVDEVEKQCKVLKHYINVYYDDGLPAFEDIVAHVRETESIGINLEYIHITPELVEAMHRENVLVSAWTVNDTDTMIKLINMGVDNITTRYPDKLIELINTNK